MTAIQLPSDLQISDAGKDGRLSYVWHQFFDQLLAQTNSSASSIASNNDPTFTVAELPTGIAGSRAFATDCRAFNGAGVQEGAGVGTGCLVTHNGTAWKIAGTNVTAVA